MNVNRRWLKGWGLLCVMLLLHMFLTTSVQAAEDQSGQANAFAIPPAGMPNLNLKVKSAILLEASTGQVLYQLDADTARPPASMTKMMTEYLVMDAIKSGKIHWDDEVVTSKYAADVLGSGQLLAEGRKYKVSDLFRQLSIYSANDAAVALAQFVGGSEEQFVNMMNDEAKKMGLTDQSHFTNATGLSMKDLGKYAPNIPGETVLSARDAATLARHVVLDHPDILEMTKIPRTHAIEGDDQSELMDNWNWMLAGWESYHNNFSKYAYPGLDGLKTGHTNEAGYCFTGTAERNGMRLISVVMGTTSEPERFQETRKLLDYGFNHFEVQTVLPAKSQLDSLKTVHVKKAVHTEVQVVTQTGVQIVVKKGEQGDHLKIETASLPADQLVAPMKQGAVAGHVTVTYDMGTPELNVTHEVDLVTTDEVKKASGTRLFFRAIRHFFSDLFSGIKGIF